jgi:hypothetical protein
MSGKRWLPIAALIVGAAGGVPVGLHWGGGDTLADVEVSPDGRERLEIYRPTRWQRLLGYDAHDYAVARLSRAADGEMLGTSGPFYLDGAGPVTWGTGVVSLGSAARYDRSTGRWTTE